MNESVYPQASESYPEEQGAPHLPEDSSSASLGIATVRYLHEIQNGYAGSDLTDAYPDPREAISLEHPRHAYNSGETSDIAAGYITSEELDRDPELTDMVDDYYQPYLSDEFYERHDIPTAMPLSFILRQAVTRNDDGDFTMSKLAYFDLLADLASIHDKQAAEFEQRLPGYISEYSKGLEDGGLARLVPIFHDRVSKTRIELDDGFTTILEGGVGSHSVDSDGRRSVRVAPIIANERDHLSHELGHVLEGNGFAENFQVVSYLADALKEALAEHLRLYLAQGGDIQAINPELTERHADRGGYDLYRHTLDLLCNDGASSIPIQEFIDTNVAEDKGPNMKLLTSIGLNFPDHPELMFTLDTLIKDMQVGENETDQAGEAALELYIDEVRGHYLTKKSVSIHTD